MLLIWARDLSIPKWETLGSRCLRQLRRPVSCSRLLFRCTLLTQLLRDLGLWARTSKRTECMETFLRAQRSPLGFRGKQNLKIAQELLYQTKKAWCSRASWPTRFRQVQVELLRSVPFQPRRILLGHLIQFSRKLLRKENRPKPQPVFSTQHPLMVFPSAQASLKVLNIGVASVPRTKNLASWTT